MTDILNGCYVLLLYTHIYMCVLFVCVCVYRLIILQALCAYIFFLNKMLINELNNKNKNKL